MFDKLMALFNHRNEYDEQSRQVLESVHDAALDIGKIDEMKKTDGWQTVEKKIKEELQTAIMAMIMDDKTERGGRISAFIQILSTVNTKDAATNLNSAIEELVNKYNP